MDTLVPVNECWLGFHDLNSRFDWSLNSYPETDLIDLLKKLVDAEVRPSLLFDDGYESVFRFNESYSGLFIPFNRAFSVITGCEGQTNTWDLRPGRGEKPHADQKAIRRLSDQGWSILFHGHSHRSLAALSPGILDRELTEGKSKLEDWIGKPVTGLSFPFGRYSQRVIMQARQAGFTRFYSNRYASSSLGVNRVYSVYRWESMSAIRNKLKANPLELAKLWMINTCAAGTILVQETKYRL